MERVFIFFLWLLCTDAVAQTDTITSRIHQLQEVTVTETRRQHALASTAPMHLLDRHDMQLQGVTDMADALRRLPSITLRDYGGAGGMKTVSVRGFGAKHTGVSYDGVMLSECQTGEIDFSRYSLSNVDGLSLTIGDNDDIFVSARQASTPAVLSIETLRAATADRRPHLVAQVRQGSFGYVSPFLRYEQHLGSAFVLSANGEFTYADNDYPYTIQNVTETVSDRRQNSRMRSGHGELNFLWRLGTPGQLRAKLYYYDNDRQLPGLVHYYSNTSRETLRERNAFGQLTFQTHWADCLSLKVTGKWNWAASLYDDGMQASQIQDAHYYQREYYGSACLLYTPGSQWAFDYSADYCYNNLNSTLPTDARPRRHGVLQSLTAKYDSRQITVTGRLLYSLYLNDVRQGASARNVRRLSPSVSLSWLLAEGLRLRASYKEIFRVPTFNESYFFHYGSTDLQPERTHQLNVGLTWHAALRRSFNVQATVDGYYNMVRDMIVSVPYNMFVWNCVNIGKVRVLGLDATLRATQTIARRHILTATAAYTLQRVQNRTNPDSPNYGKQVAYTPEHTFSATVAWQNPWVNLSLHASGVSRRWSTNDHLPQTDIAGYGDLGTTAYRDIPLRRGTLQLRFDLKNMTDRQYEIVAGYPMPGISYQASVRYEF